MISQKLHHHIRRYVKRLQRFADRIWYAPLIGFLAALDNLVIIIPNDGILISSSMLKPKRWFLFAASVSVGSALGALALAALVQYHGVPWVLDIYPGLEETRLWAWSLEFFNRYGLVLVFVISLIPVAQLPAVVLACLAGTPLLKLTLIIFAGRFFKCLAMAYIGSHTPRLLSKIWGVKDELKDAGVKV
jgi:membrane protein YqaA with SNARE-associated domain